MKPSLHKDGIHMRPILTDEYESFYQLVNKNRSRLIRYFPNTLKAIQSKHDAKNHLNATLYKLNKKELYPFGIYKDQELVGWISIKNINREIGKAELGYYIDVDWEGQGIMSKVMQSILDYSFNDLQLNKIYLRIAKENVGSIRIAEKNGFTHEGCLRKEFRIETNELIDVEYYGLLKGI